MRDSFWRNSGLASALSVVVLLGSGMSASAEHHEGLTLPEVIQKMGSAQTGVDTARFDFNEEQRAAGGFHRRTTGRVYFSRPSHLRVDQKSPERQRLISDGTHFWLYTPAAEQQLTGLWKPWLKQTGFPAPLLGFLGDFPSTQWAQRYTILFEGYQDNLYRVLFKPKQADEATVRLWVSDETFLPSRGEAIQADSTASVSFEHLQINIPIDPALFDSRAPKGTAVVPMDS